MNFFDNIIQILNKTWQWLPIVLEMLLHCICKLRIYLDFPFFLLFNFSLSSLRAKESPDVSATNL